MRGGRKRKKKKKLTPSNSFRRKNLKNFEKTNTGGLVGPAAFGAARSATGGYGAACAMLSVFAAVAAVLYAVVLPLVAPDSEGAGADGGDKKRVGDGLSSSSSRLPPLETKSPASAS